MEKVKKILIATFILGFLGYLAYNQIVKWHNKSLVTAVSKERKDLEKTTGSLEQKINELEEELTLYKVTLTPQEKLTEVFGEETTPILSEWENKDCEDLEKQVLAFFVYLDGEDYIIRQGLEHGSYVLFEHMVKQLSAKPPIIAGEMRDIVSLMRNMAHIYRVLGNKRIELVKEILKNENDIFESMMAAFYSFYTSENCCKNKIQECPSLKILYEYAGFFLNTIAGRSYRFRRDSKIRSLTTYYSVLLLDKANDAVLNDNGIDIRPHIELSINDISNQKNLVYLKQYLTKLERLKEKYKM